MLLKNLIWLAILANPASDLAQLPRTHQPGTDGFGYVESATEADIHKKVKYDKFKNITVVHLEYPLNLNIASGDLNRLLFEPFYHCDGDSAICRPTSIYLHFMAEGSEWRFIKSDRQLILLLDGRRLNIGDLGWEGDTGNNGSWVTTYESMDISVPTTIFESIVAATVVEGQLGHRTFTMSPAHLQAMRSIFAFPPDVLQPKRTPPNSVRKSHP